MKALQKFLSIVKSLRRLDAKRSTHRQYNFSAIMPYMLEEAYEVGGAITRHDMPLLCEALGDVLFHIAYLSLLAEEQGAFRFDDVLKTINDKLTDEHPDVSEKARASDKKEESVSWHTSKRSKHSGDMQHGLLSEITTLPHLPRAQKLQAEAATVGFDWQDIDAVLDKISEEFDEVKEALVNGDREKIEDEIGDLLFVCVNLARYCRIDAESALGGTNDKFERRFAYIERALKAKGMTLDEATLKTMDALWDESKGVVK